MQTYIRLGSGESRFTRISPKARLLDQASQARIAVPRGIAIPEATYHRAVQRDLISIKRDRVRVNDPVGLMQYLDLPRYANPLVEIRSGAVPAEQEMFRATPRFAIDSTNPTEMARALSDIWDEINRDKTQRTYRFSYDVIVMAMIQPQQRGLAYTQTEYADDMLQLYSARSRHGEWRLGETAFPLPKWYHPTPAPSEHDTTEGWRWRVQQLLYKMRQALGDKDWEATWVDDGERCWLLEVYFLPQPPPRRERYISIPHNSHLAPLPSRLMVDVVSRSAQTLYAEARRMDNRLPKTRPLIQVFNGYPYANYSLLVDVLRQWGKPTDYLPSWIQGALETPPAQGKMNRGPWFRYWIKQRRLIFEVRRFMKQIPARTRDLTSFVSVSDSLLWLYQSWWRLVFLLNARLAAPLEQLLRYGVLERYKALLRNHDTALYEDLNDLRRLILQEPSVLGQFQAGRFPADHPLSAAWEAYLAKHGHRGLYEADIAQPRFRENPKPLLVSLIIPPTKTDLPPAVAGQGWWWGQQFRRTIQVREQLRYTVLHGIEALRATLVRLGEQAVQRELLPYPAALWLLSTAELGQLDKNEAPHPETLAQRELEQERFALYQMPMALWADETLDIYKRGEKRK